MLRPAHSSSRLPACARGSLRGILALIPLLALAQPLGLRQTGGRWEHDFFGTAPMARRLRILAHGPVTLQAGTAQGTISYSVRVSVRTRTEAEARRVIGRYIVRAEKQGDTTVITTPDGPIITTVVV